MAGGRHLCGDHLGGLSVPVPGGPNKQSRTPSSSVFLRNAWSTDSPEGGPIRLDGVFQVLDRAPERGVAHVQFWVACWIEVSSGTMLVAVPLVVPPSRWPLIRAITCIGFPSGRGTRRGGGSRHRRALSRVDRPECWRAGVHFAQSDSHLAVGRRHRREPHRVADGRQVQVCFPVGESLAYFQPPFRVLRPPGRQVRSRATTSEPDRSGGPTLDTERGQLPSWPAAPEGEAGSVVAVQGLGVVGQRARRRTPRCRVSPPRHLSSGDQWPAVRHSIASSWLTGWPGRR